MDIGHGLHNNVDPVAAAAAGGDGTRRRTLICLFLLAVTLAVFWQAGSHDFVDYDDGRYITENPLVAPGLTASGAAGAFTTFHAGNWHPLTWLSHMLDVALYGVNPRGHHLTNVALHSLNAVLLFLLLEGLTGAHWRSGFVAALFALHPLHVESVAWAAERKDVLSTLFWLLTLLAYARYVRRPARRTYGLALFCCAAGLMAKPMLVTLPLTLLLLDYWPLGRFSSGRGKNPSPVPSPPRGEGSVLGLSPKLGKRMLLHAFPPGGTSEKDPTSAPPLGTCFGGSAGSPPLRGGAEGRVAYVSSSISIAERRAILIRLLVEKIPFFVLSVLSAAVTLLAQYEGGAVSSLETLPLSSRVLNALAAYAGYVGKMLWPLHLAVIYPLPDTDPVTAGVLSGLALAALTGLALRGARRHPFLLTGWLWYLVTLLPVIGLIQVGRQAMADRYTYVPLIGLFMAVAWGGPALLRMDGRRRLLLPAAAAAALLACTALTWRQLGYWQDSVTLFSHAVEAVPDNDVARVRLGYALARAGRSPEAMAQYTEALRIRPRDAEAHFNMGFALMQQGRTEEAADQYRQVLQIDPGHEGAHVNLGTILAEAGRGSEAREHYDEALRVNPRNAETHFSLGLLLASEGTLRLGAAHLSEAVRLRPDFAEAHYNLGAALARAGRLEEGMDHFREALRIDPGLKEARIALETAMRRKGGAGERQIGG